jgi:hypothetical protein
VPDPQRAQLMAYPVAGAQLDRPARQRRHGVHGAKLALQARVAVGTVMPAPQQARDEQLQRVRGVRVCRFGGAGRGAQRLDAVVYSADARAQPDGGRRGGCEVRVEDDELGPARRRLKGVLAAGGVVRCAGEVGVLGCGEGGGDGDDGDGGCVDVGALVRTRG